MKQLIEFIPAVIFVGVFFTTRDFYLSTAAFMVALLLQVVYEYATYKKVETRTQVIFWIVMISGGLTLFFRNEIFVQWKPTIINWFFAAVLLGSHFFGKANMLKRMLGGQVPLPLKVWAHLNAGWAVGFFLAGALNLVVAYNFSLEFWVVYKLAGGMAITFTYIMITLVYLAKKGYLKEEMLNKEEKDLSKI